MTRGWLLSLAGAAALALLSSRAAGAVALPGASELPAATQGIGTLEPVRTICRRYWNGYRWRTRCWWVPDRDGYWAPRPWRRRPLPPGDHR